MVSKAADRLSKVRAVASPLSLETILPSRELHKSHLFDLVFLP